MIKAEAAVISFKNKIEIIQLNHVILHLHKAGLSCPPTPNSLDPVPYQPARPGALLAVPPGVLHDCLVNINLFENKLVVNAIISGIHLPPESHLNLPPTATAGLLAFRLHANPDLRRFAQRHLDKAPLVDPAQYEQLNLATVMNSHLDVISRRNRNESEADLSLALAYTSSRETFWEGIAACVAVLGPETIKAKLINDTPLDLTGLIASQIGEQGEHLATVLSLFGLVLDRVGPDFWRHSHDQEHFELAILHAVLDNPEWEQRFERLQTGSLDQALISWIPAYLASVASSAEAFPSAVATFAAVLLDRFQALRFDPSTRTNAIDAAVSVLSQVLLQPPAPVGESIVIDAEPRAASWPHAGLAGHTLDLHAAFLCKVAFDSEFAGKNDWAKARETCAGFVGKVMERDGRALREAVYGLASFESATRDLAAYENKKAKMARKQAEGSAPPPSLPPPPPTPQPPAVLVVAKAIWTAAYSTIADTDLAGIAVLVRGVRACAHLEKVSGTVYTCRSQAREQMQAINAAIDKMREPLAATVISFSDERPASLVAFLGLPYACESVIALLLSPVDVINGSAQALVKAAFDVYTRRDCFRSLLHGQPEASLRGLVLCLRTLNTAATILPEACGLSKRAVRCLLDVSDALCRPTDGLIRAPTFLNSKSADGTGVRPKLTALWKWMNQCLGVIFRKTPSWAPHFENDEMTDWMRDAIAFGVDLVNQLGTFESAIADRQSLAAPNKMSKVGRQLIGMLSKPLEELLAWLRLTDEDLLTSTFSLVVTMVQRFTRSGFAPSGEVVQKIKKIANRPADSTGSRSNTLRDEQLRAMLDALEARNDKAPPSTAQSSTATQQQWWADKMGSKPTPSSTKSGPIPILTIDDDDKPERRPKKPTTLGSNFFKPVAGAPRPGIVSASVSRINGPLSSMTKPIARPAVAPRPRGVPWTTYSSKPAVSESDEDEAESDEDGEPKGLAGLAKLQTGAPRYKKAEERNKVQMLDGPFGRGVKAGQASAARLRSSEETRRANAAALRAPADFSHLHRQILQWDPDHTASLPPGMARPPPPVPAAFASADAYFEAYEPLLLAESWEQVRQARQEGTRDEPVVKCDVAGRQQVDDFSDVFMTIQHGQLPDRYWLGESDLVLLRQGQRLTLAKIQSFTRKREFFEVTLRCHFGTDKHDAGAGMSARAKWDLTKLVNLSTLHREYSALQSVRYLELFPEILQPSPPPIPPVDPRQLQRTMTAYKTNEPQAKAIIGSLQTRGFSLIQGPPGTGKTKTILGLIGAFIDSRPRPSAPIVLGKATDPKSVEPVAKVLLCAPSNAAVDEVAKRLKEGIHNSAGQLIRPKVVRIGADSSIDVDVKELFIDSLVEAAMGQDGGGKGNRDGQQEAQQAMLADRAQLDALRDERNTKQAEIEAVEHSAARRAELTAEVKAVKAKMFQLTQKLDSERDKAQQNKRAMDARTRQVRLQILSDADVICSTLSGAGHDYMAQLPFDFETVIIDEAAQSIELSSLIPLKYGCQRCILVGDPLQLPPTVMSKDAARAGYERSLFVRMMQRGSQSVHLLSIQYRMNPLISAFPSAAFYQSRLLDGPNMADVTKRPWHRSSLFPPYSFFHVKGGSEVQGRSHSLTNPVEAGVAVALYERLTRDFVGSGSEYTVGVVTPYKGQVGELKRQFSRRFGERVLTTVSFNTVDGFQGQEKDIIILSCVRGGPAASGVGFLSDTRRMNVALTRARASLFILGDSNKLRSNEHWGNLVQDADVRGLLSQVDAAHFRSAAPPPLAAPKTGGAAARSVAKPVRMDPTPAGPTVRGGFPKPTAFAPPTVLGASTLAGVGGANERPSVAGAGARAGEGTPRGGPKNGGPVGVKFEGGESQLEEGEVREAGLAARIAPSEPAVAKPPAPVARPRAAPSLFVPKKVLFFRVACLFIYCYCPQKGCAGELTRPLLPSLHVCSGPGNRWAGRRSARLGRVARAPELAP